MIFVSFFKKIVNMKVSNTISLLPVIDIPIMAHTLFAYLFVKLLFLSLKEETKFHWLSSGRIARIAFFHYYYF